MSVYTVSSRRFALIINFIGFGSKLVVVGALEKFFSRKCRTFLSKLGKPTRKAKERGKFTEHRFSIKFLFLFSFVVIQERNNTRDLKFYLYIRLTYIGTL